jgi:hypothetical protein
MRLRSLAFVPVLAGSLAVLHCGGATNLSAQDAGPSPAEGGPQDDGGLPPDGGPAPRPNPDAVGATTSSKVDLLLVVDDSASMGDKGRLLASSIGTLLRRVAVAGDVHVGVISSSLGSFGGDVCANGGKQNSLAHLNTNGPGGVPVAGAAKGFLTYGGGGATDINALVADAEQLVQGVGEAGCGLEAQLESTYRFLVQPDPWASVQINASKQAQYVGIDQDVLVQRKAFLRPDSLVAVVMLTDEDDSSADPRSIGGQGWAFESSQFPGSPVFRADGKTTTAPRATSSCPSNPASADCTSCGFAATCNPADAACQNIKNDPECQKNGGYYGPSEDQLNVRFHRMKERYGIDPQFPLSRYVDGFTKQRAPSRKGEHVVSVGATGFSTMSSYVGDADCTNPLFAASLPSGQGDEICNLPQGPRGKELVVFAVIGGVPESLVGASPNWTKILGADPGAFNFDGIDPHMIPSVLARAGLAQPSSTRGDNGTDPIHGREWDTGGNDLQYACTFTLPTVRNCTAADTSCDCGGVSVPPLCGATPGQQVKAKAYPTTRELRVVKELGDRGIVGSICPTDATQGYVSTMNTLADRLAPHIK